MDRMSDEGNQTDRKIILIAHDLGGLLVQNAMSISRGSAERHIREVGLNVTGILFPGTPNFGADRSQWTSLSSTIRQALGFPSPNISSILDPGSETLATVQREFHGLLRCRKSDNQEIYITCFYEGLPSGSIGVVRH